MCSVEKEKKKSLVVAYTAGVILTGKTAKRRHFLLSMQTPPHHCTTWVILVAYTKNRKYLIAFGTVSLVQLPAWRSRSLPAVQEGGTPFPTSPKQGRGYWSPLHLRCSSFCIRPALKCSALLNNTLDHMQEVLKPLFSSN